MLIITLKKDEKILIGQDVCIRVMKIRGRDVKVGIEAPVVIPVCRDRALKMADAD
jgi:carbon storage regulator CsrA